MCKPHKHGKAPKKKARTAALEQHMDRKIAEPIAQSQQSAFQGENGMA